MQALKEPLVLFLKNLSVRGGGEGGVYIYISSDVSANH